MGPCPWSRGAWGRGFGAQRSCEPAASSVVLFSLLVAFLVFKNNTEGINKMPKEMKVKWQEGVCVSVFGFSLCVFFENIASVSPVGRVGRQCLLSLPRQVTASDPARAVPRPPGDASRFRLACSGAVPPFPVAFLGTTWPCNPECTGGSEPGLDPSVPLSQEPQGCAAHFEDKQRGA